MNFVTTTKGIDVALAHIVEVQEFQKDSVDQPTPPCLPFVLHKYDTKIEASLQGMDREWQRAHDRHERSKERYNKNMERYKELNVVSTKFEITTVTKSTHIVDEHPFKIEETIDEI